MNVNVNVNVHTLNYIFILRRGLLGILKKKRFILFNFGCAGSLLLCMGFL